MSNPALPPNIIWHPSYQPAAGNAQPGQAGAAQQPLRPWLPPQVVVAGTEQSTNTQDKSSSEQSNGSAAPAPENQTPVISAPAPGQAYIAYPELTCLHCLGANPPGKLGYVVSYIPADAAQGQPGPHALASALGGNWQKVSRPSARSPSASFARTGSVAEGDEGEDETRGRGSGRGPRRAARSQSAFRAEEIVGDKQYIPDGAEDDLVGHQVE